MAIARNTIVHNNTVTDWWSFTFLRNSRARLSEVQKKIPKHVTMAAFFITISERSMRSSITFLSATISIICLRPLLISTLVKLKFDTCYEAKIILWVHDCALLTILFVSFGRRLENRLGEAFRAWLALFYCLCVEKIWVVSLEYSAPPDGALAL